MRRCGLQQNAFTFSSRICACEKGLLQRRAWASYAAISVSEKGKQWKRAVHLLDDVGRFQSITALPSALS